MATITLNLPEQQAVALSAAAAALGLSLQEWLQTLGIRGTNVIDWSQCPAVESIQERSVAPGC